MKLDMEISFGSLLKKEQELCGDKVEYMRNDDELLLVLSDGLGSGVKANILATLTSKIILTMIEGGAEIDEVVDTLVDTLPVCKERRVAYSTFTIFRFTGGKLHLVEYDNPDTIILRGGEVFEPDKRPLTLHDKEIKVSECSFMEGDWFVTMSDGIPSASKTPFVRDSWGRESIAAFVKERAQKGISPFLMKKYILEECFRRYDGKIGDDSTVAVCRVKHKSPLHVMVGPPLDPKDDERIVAEFMNTHGKKIVCGGQTARIISRVTGKNLSLLKRQLGTQLPPMGELEGLDLVTEGIVTVTKATEIMERLDEMTTYEFECMAQSDNGAERLIHMLMEGGNRIRFFMGRSSNVAHDHVKGIEFGQKVEVLERLYKLLKKQHKLVTIEYC